MLSAATAKQTVGAPALYVITDEGVAYPVVNGLALLYLGYTAHDLSFSAPQLLSLLPKGPALDPDAGGALLSADRRLGEVATDVHGQSRRQLVRLSASAARRQDGRCGVAG